MVVAGLEFVLYGVLIGLMHVEPVAAAYVTGIIFVALGLLIGDRFPFRRQP